jgi:hypothetical protein
MNSGSHWKGRERVGSKGWAVNHQPGMSVDGHSHHDHQKGDFQVSKRGSLSYGEAGKRGSKGKNWITGRYSWDAVCICIVAHLCRI